MIRAHVNIFFSGRVRIPCVPLVWRMPGCLCVAALYYCRLDVFHIVYGSARCFCVPES